MIGVRDVCNIAPPVVFDRMSMVCTWHVCSKRLPAVISQMPIIGVWHVGTIGLQAVYNRIPMFGSHMFDLQDRQRFLVECR